MGKRILLFVFLLCGVISIQAQVTGSVSITSGLGYVSAGDGTNNITITACGPVTFSVSGSASYTFPYLHSVIISSSSSGSISSSDPNFSFFGGGSGACNPVVAPAGFYYSDLGAPSGFDGACGGIPGLPYPSSPGHNVVDKWGIGAPYAVSFDVDGMNGSCGDSQTIDVDMNDDAVYGGGVGGGGGTISGSITITIISETPEILGPSSINLSCDDPELSSPSDLNVIGCIDVTSDYIDDAYTPDCAGYSFTRRWNYMSACGEAAPEFVQTITVDPTPAPTYSIPALPSNIACDAAASFTAPNVPYSNGASASCLIDGVAVPNIDASAITTCGGTITVTWEIPDACGNLIPETSTITVDPPAPGVPSSVSDENYPCLADFTSASVPVVTWSGTCGNDGTFPAPSEIGVPMGCTGGTVTRTWTANDLCGNPITQTQTITIDPTLPGTPSPVANENYPCLADFTAASVPVVTWSGTCGNDGTFPAPTEAGVPVGCEGGTVTRTWTANDLCGNPITQTQTITIAPTLPGTPSPVANENYPCLADFTAASVPVVTWSGTCGNDGTFPAPTEAGVPVGCEGGTVTRTWTANDVCGNPITQTQTITIAPTLPGTPSPVANENYPCLADFTAASVPVVTWSGTCGNDGTFPAPTEAGVPVGCEGGTVTRTWTANDVCGNPITQTQTITIAPTLPGTPSPVANENYPCLADFTAASVPVVTWSGTCGNDGTFPAPTEAGVPVGCEGGTVTRTWTANDVCGNPITQTQTITIAPTLPGTPSPVANENYPCLADFTAASVPVVTWSGTCGNNGTFPAPTEAGVPVGCEGGTVTRTWTANDVCGNPITQTQTITIAPTLPGTPSPVANENYPCLADFTAASVPVVTWTGTCGNNGIFPAPTEVGVPVGCAGGTVTRTWTANDVCGNPITQTQTITIAPTLPGTPSPVANENYPCLADFTAASVPVVTWTGTCGNNGTFPAPTEVGVPVGCSGGTVTRTWSTNDVCGNPITQTQTITIAPTLPGTPSPVANENYPCLADFTAASVPVVTWTGTCGNNGTFPSPTEVGVPVGCAGGIVTRTWSTNDVCGNPITQIQTITIAPTLPGTPSPVANENYPCLADFTAASVPVVTWTGTCGNNGTFPPPSEVGVPTDCAGGTITRTWTALDVCGNTITQTQNITIAPTLPGTPSPIAAENYTCLADFTAAPVPVVTWTGTCGNNGTFLAPTESGVPTDCSGGTVTRTWTALDLCGNTISQTQSIIISPVADPLWTSTLPSNQNVNCDDIPTFLSSLNSLNYSNFAASTCLITGSASPSNDYNASLSCGDQFRVWWELPDGCGPGFTTHEITITIRDNDSPTFSIPGNVNIDCDLDYTDDANTGGPAFNVLDNCDLDPEVTISYNDISVGCTKRYEKVFTVTDDCGNATTRTQIININAGSAADWENAPDAVINISCLADLPPLIDLNYGGASSACATPETVSGVENRSSFPNLRCGVIIRTWTPDPSLCGVPDPFIQTININPTVPPVFVGTLPSDETLDCGETLPAPSNLILNLSCATSTISVVPSTSFSGNNVTYTWSFTGICPVDELSHTQTITIPEAIDFVIDAPTAICEGAEIRSTDFTFFDQTSLNDLNVTYYTDPGFTNELSSLEVNAPLVIYVRVTNALGCSEETTINIGMIPAVSAGSDLSFDFCGNETINLLDYVDGSADLSGDFTDIDGSFVSLTSYSNISLSTLSPGSYRLQYEVLGLQSCPADEAIITFNIIGKPEIIVTNKKCAADLATYEFEVELKGSFSGLTASSGTVTSSGNGKFTIKGVNSSDDVILTATGSVTNCDATQTVVKANCACGIIPEPTILTAGKFNCLNSPNPVLEVGNIAVGNKAIWYSDAALTNKINEGVTYTPTVTAVGTYEYFVIQEAPGNCLSNAVKISFEIKPLPVVVNVSLEACDDDFDGLTTFNLTSKRGEINAVAANTVTYHLSLSDAQNNLNAITTPNAFKNTIADNQKIFTRVINANGCVSTGEFNLIVNKKPDISLVIADATCLGANDGKVSITVNNGLTNLQYKIVKTPYGANTSFSNLAIGNDTVSVRSDKGCVTTAAFAIKDGIKLVASAVQIACNDNNTKTDPADDQVTISFTVTGGTGKFIIKENNVQIGGDYDYGVLVSLPARAADGSSGKLTIEDKTNGCPIEVSYGPLDPCSSDCTISANVVPGTCDNGGTPNDPSDDKTTYTITATAANGGAIATLFVDGIESGNIVYGSPKKITFPADGLTHTIKLVDGLKSACVFNYTTPTLVSCSDVCVIGAITPISVCNDSGTETDAADDTYSVTFKVIAANSSSLAYTIEGQTGTYEYGKDYTFGPYLISGGDKTFKVIDGNAKCEQTFTATAPKTCSSKCKISFDQFSTTCINKGTSTNPGDDTYEIKMLVKQINGSAAGYKIFIDQVLHSNGIYNVEKTISLAADGGEHLVSIEDADDANCSDSKLTQKLIPCSDECVIGTITPNAQCNDNGTETDATDDTYTITFNVTAQNSSSITYTIEGESGTYEYGKSYTFGPFLITAGDKTYKVIDGNNKCEKSFTAKAPKACSSKCKISFDQFSANCSNKGTITNPGDDTYEVKMLVKQINGSTAVIKYSSIRSSIAMVFIILRRLFLCQQMVKNIW